MLDASGAAEVLDVALRVAAVLRIWPGPNSAAVQLELGGPVQAVRRAQATRHLHTEGADGKCGGTFHQSSGGPGWHAFFFLYHGGPGQPNPSFQATRLSSEAVPVALNAGCGPPTPT